MKKVLLILTLLFSLLGCKKEPEYSVLEVQGIAMLPTFKDSEIIDYDSTYPFENLKHGDVVVLDLKRMSDYTVDQPNLIIKRVVALGGDTIEILDNNLYINGEIQQEDYLKEYEYTNFAKITVPANEIFVLGDNRNMSIDSRTLGTYTTDYYFGLVVEK